MEDWRKRFKNLVMAEGTKDGRIPPITMGELLIQSQKPNIKPLEDFIEQEIEKAREEGRGAERDRIFRGLDSIDCIKEALPKNYSASSMQLGINRAKEIVLEKELSKLTTK